MKKNFTGKNSEKNLDSLVQIRSGLNFRGKVEQNAEGQLLVIQTKDITNNGAVNITSLIPVSIDTIKKEHLLREGDILLRARGGSNFPAATIRGLSTDTVAALPILILRVEHQSKIVPEYLAWYLNQPRTQNILQSLAQSTFVPTISKSSLLDLQISLPSIEVQRKIVALSQLLEAENRLLQIISVKRQELTTQLLMQSAQDGQLSSELTSFFRPITSECQI